MSEKIERTIIIYDSGFAAGHSQIVFYKVLGDWTDLDNIYVNAAHKEPIMQRLNDLEVILDKMTPLYTFPLDTARKLNTAVIVTGIVE